MSSKLAVEVFGFSFANPFLLASTPATRASRWPFIASAGWAGGVTWSGDCHEEGRTFPRLYAPNMHVDTATLWTCQNLGVSAGLVLHGRSVSVELIGDRVREAKMAGLPVGANIMFGPESEPWVEAARVAENAGADFLELNLSCPRRPLGLYFCTDIAVTTKIVAEVKAATRLPVVAKLHAWLLPDDLKNLAVKVVEAGADSICCTNIFFGLAGVDVKTGLPWAHGLDAQEVLRGTVSSCSGSVTKPLGLRAVAEVASVVDVPIIGVGGITEWQDAVEYMMAGASVVQVGMAAMLSGYGMVRNLVRGMEQFMREEGYSHPRDFVGLSRRKVTGLGAPQRPMAPVTMMPRMLVDEQKCDGCGRCVAACQATADGAMRLRRKIARVDDGLCIRCNACRLVCPRYAIQPALSYDTYNSQDIVP